MKISLTPRTHEILDTLSLQLRQPRSTVVTYLLETDWKPKKTTLLAENDTIPPLLWRMPKRKASTLIETRLAPPPSQHLIDFQIAQLLLISNGYATPLSVFLEAIVSGNFEIGDDPHGIATVFANTCKAVPSKESC